MAVRRRKLKLLRHDRMREGGQLVGAGPELVAPLHVLRLDDQVRKFRVLLQFCLSTSSPSGVPSQTTGGRVTEIWPDHRLAAP
jgi:hypothetical protein